MHHFRAKYTASPDLPIWMAVEVMSLGCVVTMYKGCLDDVQQLVAAPFGVTNGVLGSWLLALNHVRNICAHHGRLWNRALVRPPKLPDGEAWQQPKINATRAYAALAICNYLVNTITRGASTWGSRLATLIAEHPRVAIRDMGFPAAWRESPLWANAR